MHETADLNTASSAIIAQSDTHDAAGCGSERGRRFRGLLTFGQGQLVLSYLGLTCLHEAIIPFWAAPWLELPFSDTDGGGDTFAGYASLNRLSKSAPACNADICLFCSPVDIIAEVPLRIPHLSRANPAVECITIRRDIVPIDMHIGTGDSE